MPTIGKRYGAIAPRFVIGISLASLFVVGIFAAYWLTRPGQTDVASRRIDASMGGTVGSHGSASVEIPGGALAESATITVKAKTGDAPAQPGIHVLGQVWRCQVNDQEHHRFLKEVTIRLPFNPALRPEGTTDNRVALAFWTGSEWERIPGSRLDVPSGQVVGHVNHFTDFAAVLPDPPVKPMELFNSTSKPIEFATTRSAAMQPQTTIVVLPGETRSLFVTPKRDHVWWRWDGEKGWPRDIETPDTSDDLIKWMWTGGLPDLVVNTEDLKGTKVAPGGKGTPIVRAGMKQVKLFNASSAPVEYALTKDPNLQPQTVLVVHPGGTRSFFAEPLKDFIWWRWQKDGWADELQIPASDELELQLKFMDGPRPLLVANPEGASGTEVRASGMKVVELTNTTKNDVEYALTADPNKAPLTLIVVKPGMTKKFFATPTKEHLWWRFRDQITFKEPKQIPDLKPPVYFWSFEATGDSNRPAIGEAAFDVDIAKVGSGVKGTKQVKGGSLGFAPRSPSPKMPKYTPGVASLAISPDNRFLAIGFRTAIKEIMEGKLIVDRVPDPDAAYLVVWDIANGKEHAILSGHTRGVPFVAFSSDGKYLVSGSDDGSAKVWNPVSKSIVRTINAKSPFALAADAKILASGDFDGLGKDRKLIQDKPGQVRLWELATGNLLKTIPTGPTSVSTVSLSADGKTLAFAAVNVDDWPYIHGAVTVYDLVKATGSVRVKLGNQNTTLTHDGKSLYYHERSGPGRFMDLATGKERFSPHRFGMRGFTADSKWAVTLHFNEVGIRDMESFEQLAWSDQLHGTMMQLPISGERGPEREQGCLVNVVAISLDGQLVATAAGGSHWAWPGVYPVRHAVKIFDVTDKATGEKLLAAALAVENPKKKVIVDTRPKASDEPVWKGRPLSAWIQQLKTAKDQDTRSAAFNAIASLGPKAKDAVPALVACLKDSSLQELQKREALFTLGQIGSSAKEAVSVMVELGKSKPDWSFEIASTLSKIGPEAKEAIPFLLEVAKRDGRGRAVAYEAIAKIDHTVALPFCQEKLSSPNLEERLAAVVGLSVMGPHAKPALKELRKVVTDPGDQILMELIRTAAARTLGNIGPDAKEAVPDLIALLKKQGDEDIIQALVRIDVEAAVPVLAKELNGGKSSRHAVFDLLASLGPAAKPAVKDVAALLTSDNKLLAADALNKLGANAVDATPLLLEVLARQYSNISDASQKSNQHEVIKSCVATLGKIGEPAVPGLVQILKGKDPAPKQDAMRALSQMGTKAKGATQELMEIFKAPELPMRLLAADALGRIGADARAAVPNLIEAIKDNHLRRVAIQALGRIGPDAKDAVPHLIEALKDKTLDVQPAAIAALGSIGPEARAAFGPLAELRNDIRIQGAIHTALKNIDPERAAKLGIK